MSSSYSQASLFAALLLIVRTTASSAVFPSQCYSKENNTTTTSPGVPCGIPSDSGYLSCCGPGNICHESGICSVIEASTLAAGYYVGGCTDPTFASPACNKACGDIISDQITYNATSGLWQCCDAIDGQFACSNPDIGSFFAAAPNDLKPTFTAEASSSSGSNLSNGAKIGIIGGTVNAALFITLGVGWFIWRRKRKERLAATKLESEEMGRESSRHEMLSRNSDTERSSRHEMGIGENITPPAYTSTNTSTGWPRELAGLDVVEPRASLPEKPIEKYSEIEGGHGGKNELQGSGAAMAEMYQAHVIHEMP